jgi:uncharacterized protein YgbK (DUF1537 family)
MKEADLLCHFAEQMDGAIGSFTVRELELPLAERAARWEQALQSGYDALLIDALNEEHMRSLGQLLGKAAEASPQFVIGSSGMSYALGAFWRERYSLQQREEPELEPEQTLVLSGSCSPMTNMQISHAAAHHFSKIKVDARMLMADHDNDAVNGKLMQAAEQLWKEGRSLILYTADGPEDESIGQMHELLARRGEPASATGERIGRKLGAIAKTMIAKLGIVVAGGDTSGFAALAIGLDALELLQRTAPGAPICRGYSADPAIDGIQIALKGGQLGQPDYFMRVAAGGKEGL